MSYRRRHTRITYEGVSFLSILAFIVIGSIMRQINLLVLLSGLMIAPFFFNWRISMKMLERLVVHRHLPDWVHAGTPFTVSWRIQNHRAGIPAWGLKLTDQVCQRTAEKDSKADAEKVVVVGESVSADSSGEIAYRCLLPQRGVYELGPAEISSAFPVGLIRSRIRIPEKQNLPVAPPIGTLTRSWQRMVRNQIVGESLSQRRRGATDEEFYAIRQWQSGDNPRFVHWRSSAKRGELMVRQFDSRVDSRWIVVLDLHGPDSTYQDQAYALSFFATVVSQWGRGQNAFQFALFGDRETVTRPSDAHALQQLMPKLAVVQPAEGESASEGMLEMLGSARTETCAVVISTRSRAEALPPGFGPTRCHWLDVRRDENKKYFVPATAMVHRFVHDTIGSSEAASR